MNNVKTDCPVCKCKNTLEMTSKTEKIPYFGEIMESTILCSECGYRHSDTICLEQKEPVRYSLIIKMNILFIACLFFFSIIQLSLVFCWKSKKQHRFVKDPDWYVSESPN